MYTHLLIKGERLGAAPNSIIKRFIIFSSLNEHIPFFVYRLNGQVNSLNYRLSFS